MPKETHESHEIGRHRDISISVFETSIPEAFNNGRVDEWEFSMLQMFHLGVFSELVSVDHKKKPNCKKSTGRDQ